jgi:glycosyltransferase involved in cell wall biosynthesis
VEYENIVVTLFPENHFGEELHCDKLICLNLRSLFSLPLALIKFRKLMRSEKPDIVHTHLFWPTIIARFTVPEKIPLVTTIHAFIATSVEYKQWHIRFLDKLSYRFRNSIIAADAKGALDEYFSFLNLKPYKAYPLYTFVDTGRFEPRNTQPGIPSPVFRVISVGALRLQKNYTFLVRAFAQLKQEPIELHIYGSGDRQQELQRLIDETGARVVLKGEENHIEKIMPQYDLYVMSSSYEGFSLSVLEAMAMGMPLMLSDIVSFREQCEGVADFFSLSGEMDFVKKISDLSKAPSEVLKQKGNKARERAVRNFTLVHHLEVLRKIYTDALSDAETKA